MTQKIALTMSAAVREKFTIELRQEMMLISATSVSLTTMLTLIDAAPKFLGVDGPSRVYMDEGGVASIEGVHSVFYTLEGREAWREAQLSSVAPGTHFRLRCWAAAGDHGVSACTLFNKLGARDGLRVRSQGAPDGPYDGADLRRCVLVARAADKDGLDWSSRIGELSQISGWAAVAAHWDELVALLVEEIGQDLSGKHAPKTHARLSELRSLESAP